MSTLQVTNKMTTETAKAIINGKEVVYQYNYTDSATVINTVNFQCQDPTSGNTVSGVLTESGQLNLNGIVPSFDFASIASMFEIAKSIILDSKAKNNPTLLEDDKKTKETQPLKE